jgi:adenylate cyclase class IV
MEVEYCTSDDIDIKTEKNKIQEFINSLGISVSEELNMGKPEMYMKKHNIDDINSIIGTLELN